MLLALAIQIDMAAPGINLSILYSDALEAADLHLTLRKIQSVNKLATLWRKVT